MKKQLFFIVNLFFIINLFSTERPRDLRIGSKRSSSEIEFETTFESPPPVKRVRIKERKEGALHRAIKEGDRSKVIDLLQPFKGSGANPNRPDELGITPVHLAILENKGSFLHILKEYNTYRSPVNFSAQDDKGHTPLHLACSLGYKKNIQILLSLGAKLDIRNNMKQTPLEVAEFAGSLECAQLIQEHIAKAGRSHTDILTEVQKRNEGQSARSTAAAKEEEIDKCPICIEDIKKEPIFLFNCTHPLCKDCSTGQASTYKNCFTCNSSLKKELTSKEKLAFKKAEKARKQDADEAASEAEVLRILAIQYRSIF
jgi:hypothetical protein